MPPVHQRVSPCAVADVAPRSLRQVPLRIADHLAHVRVVVVAELRSARLDRKIARLPHTVRLPCLEPLFECALALCTASAPVLSLRTWYWGSSFDARTVRPAASVSDVISRCTVPVTVVPRLRHCTLSPLRNFLSVNSLRFLIGPARMPGF